MNSKLEKSVWCKSRLCWFGIAVLVVVFFSSFCVYYSVNNSETTQRTGEITSVAGPVQVHRGSGFIPAVSAQTVPEDFSGADVKILFVGNSHTQSHGMSEMIADLIRWNQPEKVVVAKVFSVGFLDHAKDNKHFVRLLDQHSWDFVILQAQRISSSGRFEYSTAEGIEIAKIAKAKGSEVFFFSEWGLKANASSTKRTDACYRDMAEQAEVGIIPVGLIWEDVLKNSPELELYDSDGNHQSYIGSRLTALAIASFLLNTDPETFTEFSNSGVRADQWKSFCKSCSIVWQNESKN